MEVEEDRHRLLRERRQGLHRPEGVALPLVQDPAVGVDPAAGHGPRHHRPPGGLERPEIAKQAFLLVGDDGERRVSRAQVIAGWLSEQALYFEAIDVVPRVAVGRRIRHSRP